MITRRSLEREHCLGEKSGSTKESYSSSKTVYVIPEQAERKPDVSFMRRYGPQALKNR